MLLKYTLLLTLSSFVVTTTTAAPSKYKRDVVVVPNHATVLHEKRVVEEEDSPLPVLADDGILWTVTTTDKSTTDLGKAYHRRRRRHRHRHRQLPKSQVIAYKRDCIQTGKAD